MFHRVFRPACLVALAILALVPTALRATTFVVTRAADTDDGVCDRRCSLREAVLAANRHPGPDFITLPRGVFKLSLAGGDEDLGATGDLDVTDDLGMIGALDGGTIVDGGGIDRVLDVHGLVGVFVAYMTVRNGVAAGSNPSGGAIRNSGGHLDIIASTISGNSAPGFGGAIYSDGVRSTLTVLASTISGNTAGGGGGGVATAGGVAMANSTFSGNRSLQDFGGGLYLFSEAQADFDNVTITGNMAAQRGGGLFVEAPIAAGTPVLANSIVAANSASRDVDCSGAILSGGYNLIGQGEGCPGFSVTGGDQTGTAAAPLDPRLGPLADNGGPTPTHALLAGSPALNAGNPTPAGGSFPTGGEGSCQREDQRGIRRHRTRCDIGAFELRGR